MLDLLAVKFLPRLLPFMARHFFINAPLDTGDRGLCADPCRTYHDLPARWRNRLRRLRMAWTKPILKEIACGMEINMYAPAEDEPVLF